MIKPKFQKNSAKKQIEELNECFSPDNKESLYMHLNISSRPYHHEELYTLLNSLKVKPKIIAISESRIRKDRQPISNISLQNYTYDHTTTETSKGGALLYIENDLTYKTHKYKFITYIYIHII